jgi:hypothetical protein
MLLRFLTDQSDAHMQSVVKTLAQETLPQVITRAWRDAVAEDLALAPLTPEELELLKGRRGKQAVRRIVLDPIRAYGATLLIVGVAEAFILYMRIGDGEVLTVSASGEIGQPLPGVDTPGDETDSLCSANAWRDLSSVYQTLAGDPPALILLTTDGYANSFTTEEGFFKVGTDLLLMLREQGLDSVGSRLERWLDQASREGSGDDCTLGLIYLEPDAVTEEPPKATEEDRAETHPVSPTDLAETDPVSPTDLPVTFDQE